MTNLRNLVDQYLLVRRALGWKLRETGNILKEFSDFMALKKAKFITTKLTVIFSRRNKNSTQNCWARRFYAVRLFAKFCKAIDAKTEVAPAGIIVYKRYRPEPYIYSDKQIKEILVASRELPSRTGWATNVFPAVLGLIAVTGMRISEALNLKCENLDLENYILTIKETKYRQTRHLPLHDSTIKELKLYLKMKKKFHPHSLSQKLFLSSTGTDLSIKAVEKIFVLICKQLGLRKIESSKRPRIHDLRHTFAVNTLLRWYRQGRNVEQHIALLSTYLGHNHPANTYWYLSATPELLSLAAKRLNLRLGDLP